MQLTSQQSNCAEQIKAKKKMSLEKVDVEIRFSFRGNQADKLINEQSTHGTNRI